MRRPQQCPYREAHYHSERTVHCNLVKQITGVQDDSLTQVNANACEACCRLELPSESSINRVIASSIYQVTREVLARGGVAGCDAAKAKRLQRSVVDKLVVPSAAPVPLATQHRDPCFFLGEEAGTRHCAGCRGSVQVKVYRCCHTLHSKTTIRECQSCDDFEPRPARPSEWKWAVGVVTAPRQEPTLERCLASLASAGWDSPRLFAEPAANIPARFGRLPISRRDQPLGAWPNWFLGLSELVHRHPSADVYFMLEDDAVFSRNIRSYLEASLWPAERIGALSIYCPAPYASGTTGWNRIDDGWGLVGAVTLLFPGAAARALLAHPEVVNHRWRGPRRGLHHCDAVVGRWAKRVGLQVLYHSPSLAQHIGVTSTSWSSHNGHPARTAINFAGEEFDARSLLPMEPSESKAQESVATDGTRRQSLQ